MLINHVSGLSVVNVKWSSMVCNFKIVVFVYQKNLISNESQQYSFHQNIGWWSESWKNYIEFGIS